MLKTIYTVLFTAIVSVLTASAQTATVKWLGQIHDFGAFDEDMGKVTCRFPFVNTGDTPLSIISARATCGCTTSDFSTRPVEPGDTGYVEVRYNPTGRPGRFEKKVYVEMNTRPRKFTLVVKGVVIGASNTLRSRFPVEAGPVKLKTSIIPFGEVKKGKIKAAYLDLYNTTADTLRPYFDNLPEYLGATVSDGIVAPGDYAAFAISFDSSRKDLYGLVSDSVRFIPDPAHKDDAVTLSTVAVVVEDFSAMRPEKRANAPIVSIVPDAVDLGVVQKDGGRVKKRLTVKNFGNDILIVRRVYSADRGVEVRISQDKIKKGKTAEIEVTVDPKEFDSGIIDARMSVISNAPDNPVKPIRIVGELKE